MTEKQVSQPTTEHSSLNDGEATIAGCVAGTLGGLVLGVLIAWLTIGEWSVTSAIVVAHVTLAMIAMGAWSAPSLFSETAPSEHHALEAVSAPAGNAGASAETEHQPDPALQA
jgi:high-affinity Fe2+/Pb2+ permease